jgi:hypothetical protein
MPLQELRQKFFCVLEVIYLNKPFSISLPKGAPETGSCEIFLPKGRSNFETGWIVMEFKPEALDQGKVIGNGAVNMPNIQITATLDSTGPKTKLNVLLGNENPLDQKNIVLDKKNDQMHNLQINWENWKITNVEWDNEKVI